MITTPSELEESYMPCKWRLMEKGKARLSVEISSITVELLNYIMDNSRWADFDYDPLGTSVIFERLKI